MALFRHKGLVERFMRMFFSQRCKMGQAFLAIHGHACASHALRACPSLGLTWLLSGTTDNLAGRWDLVGRTWVANPRENPPTIPSG